MKTYLWRWNMYRQSLKMSPNDVKESIDTFRFIDMDSNISLIQIQTFHWYWFKWTLCELKLILILSDIKEVTLSISVSRMYIWMFFSQLTRYPLHNFRSFNLNIMLRLSNSVSIIWHMKSDFYRTLACLLSPRIIVTPDKM